MTEFEQVLQECLHDLERGASSLDECLNRHPGHAQQLRPILLANAYLERGRQMQPSGAFKARVRAKLTQEMQAYPQKSTRSGLLFMRLATSFAVIVLALLITATAYAQSALPGDLFYGWKRASENVWRAVSPDPVGTDLMLADRRVDELIAVANEPALRSQVWAAYLEVISRLRSEMDAENAARILSALNSQLEELNSSGILVPQPDQDVLPQLDEPTLNPTTIPLLTPELPQIAPTDLPQIDPTVEVPTIPVPTIGIPTLIP